MKRYICILAAVSVSFAACDFNERNFEGLDELSRPTNVAAYDYTITDADITTIINALTTAGNTEMAARLTEDRMFSDLAPAAECIPLLLATKYSTSDLNSAANITYDNVITRSDELTSLSTAAHTLTEADYQLAWGSTTDFSNTFTPDVLPSTSIPAILSANFPDAAEGEYKIVDYYYAEGEPAEVYFSTSFEENTGADTGVPVNIPGWLSTTTNPTYFWECRSYQNDNYAQTPTMTAAGAIAELWLITPEVDLTDAVAPGLSFEVVVAYYRSTCLAVMVSADFDGTEAGITNATWTDITAGFELPVTPTSGYGSWTPVGPVSIADYAGQSIYIAFVYDGDQTATPAQTTTYQLDELSVAEPAETEEPVRVYAAWVFNGTTWSAAGSDVVVLQPEDYAAMGFTYLGTANAPDYLPTYLRMKYPYAQEGAAYTVAFKSGNAATDFPNHADVYTLTGGVWTPTLSETLTSQFVYSLDGWVFDPTITYTMVSADYQLVVQYVIDNLASAVPSLVHGNSNAEYYYGFSAYYSNISLRSSDRGNDPSYVELGGDPEAVTDYLRERTIEGLEIFMRYKYPDATPQVSGIDVNAYITCAIYDGTATDHGCTFWLRCVGANPSTWEYVEQTAGTVYW